MNERLIHLSVEFRICSNPGYNSLFFLDATASAFTGCTPEKPFK